MFTQIRHFRFLLLVFLFGLQTIVFSQSMANYSVTRATGIAYSSISGTGSPLGGWRNAGALPLDDNRSIATNIGFDFWYDGIRYTQFSVSTNGFLDLSASAATGTGTGAYGNTNSQFTSSPTGTYLALAPLYCNLETQSGTAALASSIKYLVAGSAPNRTLTIEWIAMTASGNTTPNLNFQTVLHETTGIIDYIYGTMTPGTFTFAYSCGINSGGLSIFPQPSQLKMQTTANTTTFSNTVQNALATLPTTNSKITFTPPAPTNPGASVLTFSVITSTGMTLNWPNWAATNYGYVIYNSTDNITFNFVAQTAANATSKAIAALTPSTTYYWQVYAVREGTLSTALTGSKATVAGANKISVLTGNWNTAATWSPAGVPALGDNVTISAGNTVTLDGTNTCNALTVNGTLKLGNTAVARTLTITTDITVSASGLLEANPAFATTHILSLGGNITNNGSINMAPNATSLCNTTFTKNGNATISGTAATNKFNKITLNMGASAANMLDITASNFSAATAFLTLTNGTLRISTVNAVNVIAFTGAAAIGSTTGLIVNSSNATVSTTAGALTLTGILTINSGILIIGSAANNDLQCTGGTFTINGGTVSIAGKYYVPNTSTLANFNMSSGTLTVASVSSTNTVFAPFQINSPGSNVNISGGTIVIQQEGGTGAQFLGYENINTTSSITGGTLQIGNGSTPASQTIYINTNAPIGNLMVNNATVSAKLFTNALSVNGNVNIATGTLVANNLNITVGGNWTDAGTFTPGTGTVTLSGVSAASITKAAGETFNLLIIGGTGIKSLGGPVTTTSNLTINAGATLDVGASNYTLNVNGNWLDNGTFNCHSGLVTMNSAAAHSITKAAGETFNNLTLTLAGIKTLGGPVTINGNLNITGSTLDVSASNYALTVNGNWTNTGTFTPRSGTVTFNGNTAQSITKAAGETFNNVVFSNTGTKSLGAPITVSGGISINAGATLDASAGNYALNLKGNWTNAGVFTPRLGTVTLNGLANQVLSGSATSTFYNLTLNNAGGANVSAGTFTVSNALTATTGQLNNTGGTFTLLANAVSNAYIGNGAGTFAGTFQCQRWTPNPGQGNWADIGSTVRNNTVNDWDQQIYISGVGGRSGSASGFESFTLFDETSPTGNYAAITSTATSITPCVGYTLWLADTYSPANWNPKNITSDGTPNYGSVTSQPLTYTAGSYDPGENHVANPYPSHITWDASGVKITKAGSVDLSTIYVISNGNYVAHGNGFDLPGGQGFIVYATAAGANTITFTQSAKNTSTASTFDFREAAPYNLKLKLSTPVMPDLFHEVTVNFDENATLGFESPYDARFINSPVKMAPGLCMVQNGMRLTRNTFNASENETVVIPVKCIIGLDAMYTLEAFGAYSMSEYSCVLLEDRLAGKVIDLKHVAAYNFGARTTDSPDRFILHLTRKSTTCEQILATVKPVDLFYTDNQVSVLNQEGMTTVRFDLDQASNATISVYDMLGKKAMADISLVAYKDLQNLDLQSAASGIYMIHINLDNKQMITKRIYLNH